MDPEALGWKPAYNLKIFHAETHQKETMACLHPDTHILFYPDRDGDIPVHLYQAVLILRRAELAPCII